MMKHNNNFGLLRLILATLVLVSHSSEMIDGNRSRELLMQFGGRMTFGEWAVDGFFIVSGYLVLKSFENSASVFSYLRKRALRIYPGFIFCAVIITAFSPLVGSLVLQWSWKDYVRALISISTLSLPGSTEAYPQLPFHSLNGSAWSITYEFRCYLMVIFLGLASLYRWRLFFALFTAALLVSHEASWPTYVGPLAKLIGYPQLFIRMAGMFCVGSCFYVFRDDIRFNKWFAIAATIGLVGSVFLPFQESVFAIFGGYLIFWFALCFQSETLSRINNENDISYGTYLYAWPISGYLIYFFSIGSPLLLFSIALPLSFMAGFLSWHLIEKHFLKTKLHASQAATT
ncbi:MULTISPECIES: acyltransferase family protein [Bradyrhizobium]|uniref:Peptidoglycan/LPS O-acetylase OafA/YrhL, contains acyltransferase and SGNH-hydrolase domains n=2 Tax=Bradyrhizobium TaxID=374 RepID=A0ABY0Q777_9BRAD|nr:MULTISPECIES: acyltransferase [Bradyrhizobium]SDJ63756.1 Peptidoglycan/LPS O-acetylase OafA/YrhL, contains acyltransferase and SGNH-hydrolase domains [Bradyrhizobium ottawaense]SEC32922.1 Peptidoglycan/LPS O-acetylase OafA/YrhL, contains acyltransferase and SGNH-hydrolase domains [Bradyrhizobium lablabi]